MERGDGREQCNLSPNAPHIARMLYKSQRGKRGHSAGGSRVADLANGLE
jgi:hypothetical protein